MLFRSRNIISRVACLASFARFFSTESSKLTHQLSAAYLLNEDPKPRKRTKTVCTIGPMTSKSSKIRELIDEGLSIARLNFSHATHEQHRQEMLEIQEALKTRPNAHVSIMLDTKGPEIRTGNNADGNITLKKGQTLEITTDYSHLGTDKRIACSYEKLPKSTGVGKKILIADGGISTKVLKIENDIVTVEVLNDGSIGSKKNMSLPGSIIDLPTITPADEVDIIDFGLKYKVDCISISFVRSKSDLDNLRKLLISKDPEHGARIQLISKIENHQGVHNLEEIIEGSDGIMVARGDLGMEVPLQKVVVIQKYITEKAINAGKFVITATQMIESMENRPRPTRAEVSDVTNSVYDLADANMTSGQTAIGQFPTECVRYLRLIAQEAEATCNYERIFNYRKNSITDPEAVGAVGVSFYLGCHFIFIETDDIRLINRLSSLRPRAYLIVFTNEKWVRAAVAGNFGVYCYHKGPDQDPRKFLANHGANYGYGADKKTRILRLQVEANKIISSRIHDLN